MINKKDKGPVKAKHLEIKVEHNRDFDDAVRRFKTVFQRERIIGQLKQREAYEKPSMKKRRKQRESIQRTLMLEAREKMIASGEWEKHQKAKMNKREKKIQARKKKEQDDTEQTR